MTRRDLTPAEKDYVMEAIYRGLTRFDHEVRQLRELRIATRGATAKTVRGTRRPALAKYLTAVVSIALRELER